MALGKAGGKNAAVLRRGREFYSGSYERAIELRRNGRSVNEIAKDLGVSYSCAYHWVKGLRKPGAGKLKEFVAFLEENGPVPVAEIKDKFPKHNELFLTASKRKLPARRLVLKRKFGEYATWYFAEGQEKELALGVDELFRKVKELGEKIKSAMG